MTSTNPDNVIERRELAKLIEDTTGDDYVTTTEAAAVVQWCREWASDCQWGDVSAEDIDGMPAPALLRTCHKALDGGLRFVLADVRNTSGERATGVRRQHSGTEDGLLWYVTDANGNRLSGSGHVHRESAIAELADIDKLAELTPGMRRAVNELRSMCPAPGDYGAAAIDVSSDAVLEFRYTAPESRDEFSEQGNRDLLAVMRDDYRDTPDSIRIVDTAANVYAPEPMTIEHVGRIATCGGCGLSWDDGRVTSMTPVPSGRCPFEAWHHADDTETSPTEIPSHWPVRPIVTRDAVAARIATEAAESFDYDPSVTDAENAAQRAADILRDLPTREAQWSLLVRIIGTPLEDRYAARTLASFSDESAALFESLTREARRDKGFPDVATRLVLDYRDIIEPIAFDGHYADESKGIGESTNLSAWRESWGAFEAVNACAMHTFGGMSLDGQRGTLDKLASVAIDSAIEALRYAITNNQNGDTD